MVPARLQRARIRRLAQVVGIATRGIAIIIGLDIDAADIRQQHDANQHKQIAERPKYAHAQAWLGARGLGGHGRAHRRLAGLAVCRPDMANLVS